ncbi:hypothetical protein VTK56DRAFT_9278 [Thermocarpiscus australiensis]
MPNATKAAHYLQQLDEARCDDNWDAVPELVRKVRKHAPDRQCLALTAETEYAIAKATLKSPQADSTRPSTSSPPSLDAAHQLPTLLAAIESETHHPQDRFQARVCAGWLLWVARDYPAALARLPMPRARPAGASSSSSSLDHQEDAAAAAADAFPPGGPAPPSEWTGVCALKAAYLRANCLARDGHREGALQAFETALPALGSVWAAAAEGGGGARQQTRYWAELFLTEFCMLVSQALRDGVRSLREPDCLACFRTWARYWAGGGKGGGGTTLLPAGGYGFRGSVPRRKVWAEYYFALSEILQGDLPFPTGYSAVDGNESSARSQLRAELKKVEMIYQGLLFTETKFPKADEERGEVEDFVRRLMQNWAILNGRGWKEHDLAAGGRDSLCRATLDTLYGAAAKTYHSTAILRHIFTVHLALAEFDLAFMAFDSWFELVKKGKARVEKTGRQEPALDDDATMLETVSACIAALCRYGSREAAEKARNLAAELEGLVQKLERGHADGADQAVPRNEAPPRTLAVAWQSIGIAQAQWARMTYESESRASIQEKAIQCLRKSLSREYGDGIDVKGVFALCLLYAEQRKLPASIELIKTALLADGTGNDNQELHNGPYWRERSLIPLWHLLALMLSARQEYFMAARACEGAIEQFKDPSVLFGSRQLNATYRSEHLNEAGIKDEKAGDGLVDEMDDYEKEGILQIKMTQLAILELVEGPAVAVNASTELLSLFPRLFGDLLDQKLELGSKAEPPKTAATLRSIRDSVFGGRSEKSSRPRQSVLNNNNNNNDNEKLTTIPSRPQTTQTVQTTATTALTPQPSNDQTDPLSSRRSMKSESSKPRSRNSLRKRDRSGSRQRAVSSSSGGPPVPPLDGDTSKYFASFDERNNRPHYSTFSSHKTGGGNHETAAPQRGDSTTSSSARPRVATGGGGQTEPESVPQEAVVASFAPLLPYVQFPQEHNKRRRKALLVKVWLVIAGFYRRAGLLEDSQKAIAEARKVAQSLEADVLGDASGTLSVRRVEWGMEKSVEEVVADVWAEKGHLSLAREKPYQARADFEAALMHFPDHPGAIVGLSTILMDIYTEKLLPPPAVPGLDLGGLSLTDDRADASNPLVARNKEGKFPPLPSEPLGLGPTRPKAKKATGSGGPTEVNGQPQQQQSPPADPPSSSSSSGLLGPQLPPPHRATSLPLNDRLAARDRAYMLLSGLARLGRGWNDSEAWLALARAYEESGQAEKARDALWWCVELEDGCGVREWTAVGAGGYVL